MKNTTLFKKLKNKTWAVTLTFIALACYLAFLFIPTGNGFAELMPYTGSNVLRGTLLNQIICICMNFKTAFTNLNILHIATLTLIAFMIFVTISSIISAFYGRRAVYKTNIFHAGLAIAVVFFYIIAVVQSADTVTTFTVNTITSFKDLFVNAAGKFTFTTYLPLMAVVALVIAIISSFSSVHGKSFFRIIVLAIACVSLAVFLFPVIKNLTIVDFLFLFRNGIGYSFTNIMFMLLGYAVLINFILIVFYLGSRRFGPVIAIYSALYAILAIIATVLVFVVGKLQIKDVFANATIYVLLSSIAQAILIFINLCLSKKSSKKEVEVITTTEIIADDFDDLRQPIQYVYENDTIENTKDEPQVTARSFITEDENDINDDTPQLTKKEKRKQEKLNKKLLKKQNKELVDTTTPSEQEEHLENEPVQEEITTIKIPVQSDTLIYTNPETEKFESVPEVLPYTQPYIRKISCAIYKRIIIFQRTVVCVIICIIF